MYSSSHGKRKMEDTCSLSRNERYARSQLACVNNKITVAGFMFLIYTCGESGSSAPAILVGWKYDSFYFFSQSVPSGRNKTCSTSDSRTTIYTVLTMWNLCSCVISLFSLPRCLCGTSLDWYPSTSTVNYVYTVRHKLYYRPINLLYYALPIPMLYLWSIYY